MMPGGQVPLAGRNAAVVDGQDVKDNCVILIMTMKIMIQLMTMTIVMVATNIMIMMLTNVARSARVPWKYA